MGTQINTCTIVAGAPDTDAAFIRAHIDRSSCIICADSGYQTLQKAGIAPDIIIGDFDSSPKPEAACEIITLPVEKDSTDTFAAVKLAIERGYEDITLFGALGNRFDHSYSNMLCLDYCRKNGVACRIVNEHNRLSLISKTVRFKKEYQYFSLFAFLEDCKGVTIKGAYYTAGFYGLEALDICRGDQFAQSNFVTDAYCEVSVQEGVLLLAESND